MKANRTSTNSNRQPYLRLSFWLDPVNQFWHSHKYSQASKDYYNNWLSEWMRTEKNLVSRQDNLNRNQ